MIYRSKTFAKIRFFYDIGNFFFLQREKYSNFAISKNRRYAFKSIQISHVLSSFAVVPDFGGVFARAGARRCDGRADDGRFSEGGLPLRGLLCR